MKPVVWFAGILLLLTFVFPNGVPLPKPPAPPTPPSVPVLPVVAPDPTIAGLLLNAPPEDKARIAGLYLGVIDVLQRDAGKLVKTTEQWAALHERTLILATDGTQLKGKYPGLDVAIEAVFDSKLGKEKDVIPADAATREKIIAGCSAIVSAAQ